MPFYAVRAGRKTGIYHDWAECEAQVKGFSRANYAKFDTISEAQDFLKSNLCKKQVTLTGKLAKAQEAKKVRKVARPKDMPIRFLKNEAIDESAGSIVVYTDGACSGNGREGARAGYGVYFPDNPDWNTHGALPLESPQTNQRAELTAIREALQAAKGTPRPVEIRTDSMYSINCLTTWFRQWEKLGWLVNKKNLDLIKSIIDEARSWQCPVFLVPAHLSKIYMFWFRDT